MYHPLLYDININIPIPNITVIIKVGNVIPNINDTTNIALIEQLSLPGLDPYNAPQLSHISEFLLEL